MTTPQTIARVAPRFRIRPAALLTALGVLTAVTVGVVIFALTGAHQTTVAIRPTASPVGASATPHTQYLGPRQVRAGLQPQTAQTYSDATPPPETGARLDHSGRNTTVTQTTDRLANYPDAPPSASTPQPSVRYYLDSQQP